MKRTRGHADHCRIEHFDEALRMLGRYSWYRLYPLYVHPKFVEAVLQEITTLGGTSQAERWKQILRDIE